MNNAQKHNLMNEWNLIEYYFKQHFLLGNKKNKTNNHNQIKYYKCDDAIAVSQKKCLTVQ